MTQEKPPVLEDEVPEIKDEIKKEPEYKDAATPNDLWETFLERRKVAPVPTAVGHGGGDASLGNPHEVGDDKSWNKPVDDFNMEEENAN